MKSKTFTNQPNFQQSPSPIASNQPSNGNPIHPPTAPTNQLTPIYTFKKNRLGLNNIKITLRNLIWYILGFIEIVLVIRFFFKLLGANSTNSFVSLVYRYSNFISRPFNNVFGTTHISVGTTHAIFDTSLIVASVIYALIAWGLVKLININHKY